MKKWMFLFLLFTNSLAAGQQLQFHYDFRHSIDPELNRRDFPGLSFEYFKDNDSTGSFLLKTQVDFTGERNSPGQLFIQVSENLRYWKPNVYLSLRYSGGLGIAPPSFGYYIANSFGMGLSVPFQWKGAWLSAGLLYRYNAFSKASHDGQVVFYFWKGYLNYRLSVSGSIVAWTQNRDLGTELTQTLSGKKFAFFGDPQIWYKVWEKVSVGTKMNLYYHALTDEHSVQFYPTIGVRRDF